MSKFKVGDRVRVYGSCLSGVLCNLNEKGTVERCGYDDYVAVRLDEPVGNAALVSFHPKQCRRLKPKAKPREWNIPLSVLEYEHRRVPAQWVDKAPRPLVDATLAIIEMLQENYGFGGSDLHTDLAPILHTVREQALDEAAQKALLRVTEPLTHDGVGCTACTANWIAMEIRALKGAPRE